jgi:hypothetical protein
MTRVASSARSASGHEDAFPRPSVSARCRFSQGTFAGTLGNGRGRADSRPSHPRLGTERFDPLETFVAAMAGPADDDPLGVIAVGLDLLDAVRVSTASQDL